MIAFARKLTLSLCPRSGLHSGRPDLPEGLPERQGSGLCQVGPGRDTPIGPTAEEEETPPCRPHASAFTRPWAVSALFQSSVQAALPGTRIPAGHLFGGAPAAPPSRPTRGQCRPQGMHTSGPGTGSTSTTQDQEDRVTLEGRGPPAPCPACPQGLAWWVHNA